MKQFVIDYTVETLDPLAEHEVNGLDYRYVYGSQNLRLSVNISPIDGGAGSIVETGTLGEQIRLYYHQDLRGTVDYLTSPVSQKVESWTHYNEWGEITHNAVVKCGYREFDLVKNYTGHKYDAVLNLYYAKARMYDAENRRFASVDPILNASRYDVSEYATNPAQLVQYLYVQNNPLIFVDPTGERYTLAEGTLAHKIIEAYIAFKYPDSIIDKYVYGLTRTTSGRGRPDVVIIDQGVYHVYEIKSETYLKNSHYRHLALKQLQSYIDALINFPQLNVDFLKKSTSVQAGTILNWSTPIILPYLADSTKVIEAWTEPDIPGMIYYKIRTKRPNEKVETEDFVTDELLVSVRYYAMAGCEYAPFVSQNLVGVDTYGDKELNDAMIEFFKDISIDLYDVTSIEVLTFADGTRYYETNSYYSSPSRNNYSLLLSIYDGEVEYYTKTAPTVPSSEIIIPFLPVPVAPVVPVVPVLPAPMPIPIV